MSSRFPENFFVGLKEPVFFIGSFFCWFLGKLSRILHKAPKVAEERKSNFNSGRLPVRTETHWHFLQNRLNPAILS
jgi:hypothetical protein